jgi:predicted nucleic acid-binding protein
MRVEALPDPVVVDASVGLKWVVEEPGSDAAVALVAGRTLLLTSALFWVEAANVLAAKERRDEHDRIALDDAWCDLAPAPLETVPLDVAAAGGALTLAVELRHPGHDCCYLELALARRTVVVTADRRFRRLADAQAGPFGRVVHLDEIRP